MLLAFAPFIIFAVMDHLAGPKIALACGLLAAALVFGRNLISPGRTTKILEFGTVILFAVLLLYTIFQGPVLSVIVVRLWVDAGLLLIILFSLLLRRPFTLQYARELVEPELWNHPEFIRTNTIITAAWALAFAVMVLAETALLCVPGIPRRLGVIVIAAALAAAFKFTSWYPERRRKFHAV
jgi:hypothetical protein